MRSPPTDGIKTGACGINAAKTTEQEEGLPTMETYTGIPAMSCPDRDLILS
jgi:hypothetical protein